MNKDSKPEYSWRQREIIAAAKNYIEANHAVRSNPCGWKSMRGPGNDPVWAEYYKLQNAYQYAYSRLWMTTDVEYGNDPIVDTAWEWRYWKVLARKCCHYQLTTGTTKQAAEIMRNLGKAEADFFEACGLSEIYKSPCQYIEEAFPKLKMS